MATIANFVARMTADFGPFNRTVSNTERQMGGLARNSQRFGRVISSAIAGIATVGLVRVIDSVQSANRSIAIATGQSGNNLRQLEEDFQEVFKTVPVAIATTSSAIGDLNTLTGASGEVLQGLTRRVLELSNLLEEDGARNASLYGRALKQWQVPAEEGIALTDKLFKVTQDYGISFGGVLSGLTEYGSVLKNANLTTEEAADFIGQLAAQGISVSRVMPGIRQSINKFAEANVEARPAIERVFTLIRDAESSTRATAIATQFFGAESQRLVTAIRNGAVQFSDLGKNLKNTEGLILDTAQSNRTLNEEITLVKNQVLSALLPAFNKVGSSIGNLTPLITNLVSNVIEAGETFIELPQNVQTAALAITAIFALSGPLMASIRLFSGAFSLAFAWPVGTIAVALIGFSAALFTWKDEIIAILKNMGKAALNWLTKPWETAVKATEQTVQAIKGSWEWLSDTLVGNSTIPEMQAKINAVIQQMMDDAEDSVDNGADKIKEKFEQLQDATRGIMDRIDPLGAAYRGLADDWTTLAEALDEGIITHEEFEKNLKLLNDELENTKERLSGHNEEFDFLISGLLPEAISKTIQFEKSQLELGSAFSQGKINFIEYNFLLDQLVDKYNEVEKASEETIQVMTEDINPLVKAWERAVERIDDAFNNMWEGIITGQGSFVNQFLGIFKKLGAETLNALITRPITAGLSGILGFGSSAATAGGLTGGAAQRGGGGITPDSNFIDFSGALNSLSGGISSTLQNIGIDGIIAQQIADGLASGVAGAGAGFLGRGLSSALFGSSGLGADIGGAAGGGIGFGIGSIFGAGPIGAGIGSFIGSAIGGLFSSEPEGKINLRTSGKDEGFKNAISASSPFGFVGADEEFSKSLKKIAPEFNKRMADIIVGFDERVASFLSDTQIDVVSKALQNAPEFTEDVGKKLDKTEFGRVLADRAINILEGLDEKVPQILRDAVAGADLMPEEVGDILTKALLPAMEGLSENASSLIRNFKGTVEEAINFADEVFKIDQNLDKLTNVFGDVGLKGFVEAAEKAGGAEVLFNLSNAFTQLSNVINNRNLPSTKSLIDQFEDQANVVFGLVQSFDGSKQSALDLSNALQVQSKVTEQLFRQIRQVSSGISETINDTIRGINLSQLDDQGKFEFFKKQAEGLASTIDSLEDPAKIGKTVDEINGFVNSLLQTLDPSQLEVLAPMIIQFLESVNERAQKRLNEIEAGAVETAGDINSTSTTLLEREEKAANDQVKASEIQKASSEVIKQASKDFKSAVEKSSENFNSIEEASIRFAIATGNIPSRFEVVVQESDVNG